MKAKRVAPIFLALTASSLAAQDILFTNRVVTFTNISGEVYSNITLVRADLDGLIYRDGASGGRISFTNLGTPLLMSLGIPTNRIATAQARAQAQALRRLAAPPTLATKSVPQAPASEQGLEIYGIKLGQRFTPAMATAKRDFNFDGFYGESVEYSFRPKNPLPSFTEHWLQITPVTTLVHTIRAGRFYADIGAWSFDQQKLLAALKDKYGKASERTLYFGSETADTYTFKNGDVEIMLYGYAPALVIWVSYTDPNLRAQAEKEFDAHGRDALKKRL
jgi:hypothetical protein